MANGGYGVMDALARDAGQPGAWPGLDELDISTIALGLGCQSLRVEDHDALLRELDEHLPTLAKRREPLLLEVAVSRRVIVCRLMGGKIVDNPSVAFLGLGEAGTAIAA